MSNPNVDQQKTGQKNPSVQENQKPKHEQGKQGQQGQQGSGNRPRPSGGDQNERDDEDR